MSSCKVQGADLAAESLGALRNKVCLFKLSDLGLWRAFPLLYLKRGMLIRLNLNTTNAMTSLHSARTAINANATYYTLYEPQARIFYTKPDDAHITMLKDKLLRQGQVEFPIHCWESHDLVHNSANETKDVSSAASIIEKTFITWVNRGANQMFLDADGTHEYPVASYANDTNASSGGARFMPLLKELRMRISGEDFPSADGLNNATLTEMKNYTELVDGFSTGVDVFSYGGHRFYTVFSYTGNQNLFVVPTINVDVGEKVNSRLV